jgi:sulfotransferase
MRLNFIAGLPRSGSTLLAGLLRQNPRIHAAMTSPVAGMVGALTNTFTAQNETSVFLDEERRRAILRATIDAYYEPLADRALAFDTNRSWPARLPLIRALYPDAKVVCCVRDVAWVMDSFERLVRRNALEPARFFSTPEERATVYSRTEVLGHRDRVVGSAWTALKEAYYGAQSDGLLLVEYDILTRRPQDCLRLIYDWLEEPQFEHDPDNVEYDEPEFDRRIGAPGLHAVRKRVEPANRETVLPPDLVERYGKLAFWRDPAGSNAFRIVGQTAKPTDGKPN